MSIQSEIVEAVRSRGYLEGWTNGQLAARQVMKLVEEVGELLDYLTWHNSLPNHEEIFQTWYRSRDTAISARGAFDGGECGTIFSTPDTIKELADIIVVCSVLAHALGVDDMMQGALDKANADIARGVR